ncbi:hypothetical protein A2567_01085 [Candidatus Azambacteria bacterium RIFOXYD1_FULL_42_11]|uniref:Phosphomannomutase/phosphoglucomutase n=3 Tax=Candidatus Azamiibacteriota TaxID=1752741 RepID=A0A1F5CG49_9BACT|nr:MAG: putative phosphomannomutase [Candidatus Azambacteria bacterium GW2011_GWA1_42_19]KKS75080.1 MAG: putative phosphomannomutase [Candidatus Azambacteria bacterium GW2011_GWA2_42_9]KKS88625.1 MAG: putative phosphomannomutase [Parcubacteria group bacterium GW2011_GWC1_43_11]OGD41824.1 MAG: hypothetical protein A2567_01085 [Candidatus Azambacteria bacterium RIFOXYD1_FULL_42_11]
MNSVNPKIFRAYDIRGIYPDELNESAAYKIGQAFTLYLKKNESEKTENIIVGQDYRLSSPILARSLMEGIIKEGGNILDIGQVSVDAVYFASSHLHFPAIMITASHNSKEWNGFKLMKKDTNLLAMDSGLEEIKNIITQNRWPKEGKTGEIKKQSIDSEFLEYAAGFTDPEYLKPMRIVIDASSGAAGPILEKILKKLPIEYKALNFKPDGNFPSHDPDPTKETNLESLITEVKTGHYHFGCAFDGDGDRIIFIDESGDPISSSIIGAIMAKYFLKQNQKAKIVYGATVGKIVFDTINAYEGVPIRERVGHTFIQRRLRKENGIFGIETSGHYYFDDNFYSDSALISFLTMLNVLSSYNKRLSILASEFNKYVAIPETNFKVENPEEFIKKIAQNFEGYEIDWLDGLTVKTDNFWLNLRLSNTEPLVRLNIEAKDELVLERVKNDFLALMEKIKK